MRVGTLAAARKVCMENKILTKEQILDRKDYEKAQKITEDFSFWGRGKDYSLHTERERCTRLIAEALKQERMEAAK